MNGCLIEGMGCPGGCVAGAGTNIPGTESTEESTGICESIQQTASTKGTR